MAPNISPQELAIFQKARRTGNLDEFTQIYFRLPKSGTWYTKEDRVEQYEMLHDAWVAAGMPEYAFEAEVQGKPVEFEVTWDPYYVPDPIFLLPHGFRILPWLKELIDPKVAYGLAITGAGTGKTCNVAVAALAMCALHPGYSFLNVAPTSKQASFMLKEIEKWAGNTGFRRFIKESKGANPLWIERPHPVITVEVFEGYPSTFTCQTVGRDAKGILGDEQNWINGDEAVLLDNIVEMHPILTSRFRGTTSMGMLRSGKLTWITNPGPGAEFRALLERYKEMKKENPDQVVVLEGVHSSANIYVTARQLAQQRMTMTGREEDRWQGGEMSAIYTDSELGEHLCEICRDNEMGKEIETNKKVKAVDDGDFGLREYEFPRIDGHHYIVVGDVGKSDVISMSSQNIPCIMVFDVTDWLDVPTKMVAFYWFDGQGTYRTFTDRFKKALRKYRAYGYYDATNIQTAMEDFGDAFGRMPNTTPVFFSGLGGQLKWCVGAATLMMQDGLFQWPYIKGMWYQAGVFDSGKKHIPKDIISCLLVFFQALRHEGAMYDKMMERYDYDEFDEEDEIIMAEDIWDGRRESAPSRYSRIKI